MKKWERLAALVFFLIAASAAVKAYDIGFGTFTDPGPGFFPFWLAIVMAAIAAAYFAANLGDGGGHQSLWAAGSLRRPALACLVMAIFSAALEFLGFCTATLILFAAWLRIVEGEGWLKAGAVSVIGTACVWGLFGFLLGISLPRGLLF